MISRYTQTLKTLSPKMMTKVVTTFDRLTLIIVSISWVVTILMMLFAIFTVNQAVKAKAEAEAAIVTEPNLPKIAMSGVGGKELQSMIAHLKQHYPDVAVTWQDNKLILGGLNGSQYHQWLTAIGQVDSLYPQFHWSISKFCVGRACSGNYLMSIELSGSKASIEMPQ